MSKALEALEKLYKRLLYLSNLTNHNKTTRELDINSVTHYLTVKQTLKKLSTIEMLVDKKQFNTNDIELLRDSIIEVLERDDDE